MQTDQTTQTETQTQIVEKTKPTPRKKPTKKEAEKTIAKAEKTIAKAKQNTLLQPSKKTIKQRLFWTFSIYIGGLFPCISFNIAHSQIKQFSTDTYMFWLLCLITLFLQIASAPNVAKFMKRYWDDYKAWCFVLGCELSMTFTTGFTAYCSLLIMVGVNAIMLVEAMNNYKPK